MAIKNYFVVSLLAFLVAFGSYGETLSKKVHDQIIAYHKQHQDLTDRGFTRPDQSRNWVYSKRDFVQYVVDLYGFAEKLRELISDHRTRATLTPAEFQRLEAAIEGDVLRHALATDIAREYSGAKSFGYSRAANNYLRFLETNAKGDDPIYLLLSIYSVHLGNAFGARIFLKRAETLGHGKLTNSLAYPKDVDGMRKALGQLIDDVDERLGGDQHGRHAKYREFILDDFVLEGLMLDVLSKANRPKNAVDFLPWHYGSSPFWIVNLLARFGLHDLRKS